MTELTPRFRLPLLQPGQAQKEQFHNEALVLADALLHAAVEGAPLAAPPAGPEEGQCWIVAAGATGAWAGQASRLAVWTAGGWRFVQPAAGAAVWDKAAGQVVRWTGAAWGDGAVAASRLMVGGRQVVGARRPAVAGPAGGTVVDAEARAAIDGVLVALRSHGLID